MDAYGAHGDPLSEALADVLSGARARGGLFHRAVLAPPWGVRVQDGAPLALASMTRGEGWALHPDADPVRLAPGDVVVLRGPEPYVLADHPDTEPQLVIHPGDCCTTPEGVDMCERLGLGVRTWGRSQDDPVVLLSGNYQLRGDLSGRLLDALPPVLVLREREWDSGLLSLVAAEVVKEAPGQQMVLDRLLDLLLISVLRAWFARPEARAPVWYRAQGDPVVGVALRLLHEQPAHAWTVAALAAKAGVSRASLARRFTELVGEPPMAYLTRWRIDLAARLLREPEATVASVARRVGYADGFALSAAFKRVRGVSPSAAR
ncbi:AraC family transcriptional regulator [Streptomyces iconiensis]|uniref:AraC family transcriptional regulator n=1 Tax=Streptomyces iconiensis TaxID=1384038 RepID=A0ABT6ZN77_9ACTN|nr:AraC family transcriptional regulator [Streptomyces iconiensis]MDJ1130510.1 AraC family transcriptional regulator [Streptomyces iconiensis]